MSDSAPQPTIFAIRGPLAREDLPALCDRFCAFLRANPAPLVHCDVSGVAADAVAVDALARMQLAAGRDGRTVRIREAPDDLRRLIALTGLRDVLPG